MTSRHACADTPTAVVIAHWRRLSPAPGTRTNGWLADTNPRLKSTSDAPAGRSPRAMPNCSALMAAILRAMPRVSTWSRSTHRSIGRMRPRHTSVGLIPYRRGFDFRSRYPRPSHMTGACVQQVLRCRVSRMKSPGWATGWVDCWSNCRQASRSTRVRRTRSSPCCAGDWVLPWRASRGTRAGSSPVPSAFCSVMQLRESLPIQRASPRLRCRADGADGNTGVGTVPRACTTTAMTKTVCGHWHTRC